MKLYLDPAPRVVRYLQERFSKHETAELPPRLDVTAYSPLGKDYPLLTISYGDSEQRSPNGAAYTVTLDMYYIPGEYWRGDDSGIDDVHDMPEQISALQDLAFQFLCDDGQLAESGVTVEGIGQFTSAPEQDDSGYPTFALQLPILAAITQGEADAT